MIGVTPIQTGWARLKSAQKCGRDGRTSFGRKLAIVRDKVWAGPLPVLAWLVEHPEGRFIIDTGDTAENSTPGYLPWWNPFFTKMVEIKVAPVEEIGFRLHAMGIDPARDIAAVILTHYHHDHTGGLHHFPHTRIIGPRDGWRLARSIKGKMMGCLPATLADLASPGVGRYGWPTDVAVLGVSPDYQGRPYLHGPGAGSLSRAHGGGCPGRRRHLLLRRRRHL